VRRVDGDDRTLDVELTVGGTFQSRGEPGFQSDSAIQPSMYCFTKSESVRTVQSIPMGASASIDLWMNGSVIIVSS
jgi:hypothetical protein